jgi:hypothetical protein
MKNGILILKQVNIELHLRTSDRTPNEKVGSAGQLAHQLPKPKVCGYLMLKEILKGMMGISHDLSYCIFPCVYEIILFIFHYCSVFFYKLFL